MNGRPIDCDDVAKLVDHYFDETLPSRDALDSHIAGCTNCQAMFAATTEALSDLPCQVFVELVTEYLEQALDTDQRARMDRHLALCEGCRAYLAQMRTTVGLTAKPSLERPQPAVRAAVLAAYVAVRRSH